MKEPIESSSDPKTIDGVATPLSGGVRRLIAADAAIFRKLRLEALRRHPEAFAAAWEDEVALPTGDFAKSLEQNVVFGAYSDDGPALVGTIGLRVPKMLKRKHKVMLWGFYVQPKARGMKLGAALLAAALEHAVTVAEEAQIRVGTANPSTTRLCTQAGFQRLSVEKRALKIEERYYDEILMVLRFGSLPPPT